MTTRLLLGLLFALGVIAGPAPGVPDPPSWMTSASRFMYCGESHTWDYGSGATRYRSNSFGPFVYYVDNTHGSATDTANTYGSESTPRLTIPYPLAAGAVVQIGGSGSYSFANNAAAMYLGGSGTEANPIFFYGTGGTNFADMPKITRAASLNQGDFCVFENIAWTNAALEFVTRADLKAAPIHDVVIRNCEFAGTGESTAKVAVSVYAVTEAYMPYNFLVVSNYFHDQGDWNGETQADALMVGTGQYVSNVWVGFNTMAHSNGDSFRCGNNSAGPTTINQYFYGNLCYENRENLIDIKVSTNVVVSGNVLHSVYDVSSANAEAIVIHYGCENIAIINNIISNCWYGISDSDVGTNLFVIGNQISHAVREGFSFYGGGNIWSAHNTYYSCSNSIRLAGSVTALFSWNDLSLSATNYDLYVNDSAVAAASTANNLLAYDGVLVNWNGTDYNSISGWIAGTSVGDGSIEDDPEFVSAATGDFRLQSTSPAVGAAASTATIQAAFATSFGYALDWTDIDGNTRVNDIGAYEYAGGGTNAPAAGRRLHIPIGSGLGGGL